MQRLHVLKDSIHGLGGGGCSATWVCVQERGGREREIVFDIEKCVKHGRGVCSLHAHDLGG